MKDKTKTKAQLIAELATLRQRVTELEVAEEHLYQRTAQLEALQQIGVTLATEFDLNTLLQTIVLCARQLLKANVGALYLYQPAQELLELVVIVGELPVPLQGVTLQRGEGLSGKVWETGQPLIVDNYQQWSGQAAIFEGAPFTTMVGVPIQWGQEFLGVLNVDNRSTPFSPADVELLSLLATQAAGAIHNARLVNSVRESEERFRQLAENIDDIFWITNLDGTETIYVSPAYEEIWGRSCESVYAAPKSWQNGLHPEDRAWVIALFEQMDRTKPNLKEYRLVQPNNSIRWVRERTFPVLNERGQLYRIAGIVEDITERKQGEGQVVESMQRHRIISDLTSDYAYVYHLGPDDKLRLEWATDAFTRITGYNPLEVAQYDDWVNLIHPEDLPWVSQRRQQALLLGQMEINEFRIITRTGQTRWLRDYMRPVWDETHHRVIGVYGAAQDITNQKQATEQIQQRTAQLEALRQIALELTAELDLETLLSSIIIRAIELLQATSGSLYLYRPEHDYLELVMGGGAFAPPVGICVQRGEGMAGMIWQTGQPLAIDNYQNWAGRLPVFVGTPYTTAVGVPIRWGQEFLGTLNLSNRSQPFLPADVELLSLFATQVATAIRNARLVRSLRESEERFRSLFEDAPISLWEEDFSRVKVYLDELRQQGVEDFAAYFEQRPQEVNYCATLVKFIDVNQASLKLYRVQDKAELLNSNQTGVLETSVSFKLALLTIAAGKTKFENEHTIQTMIGSEMHVVVSWAVAPGYEESYAKVLVGVIDITQLKQTEEALRQSEAKYRTLVEQIPAIIYTKMLDETGTLTYVSPQLEAYFGYDPDTWLASSPGWVGYLHPDDHDRVLQEATRCRLNNESFLLDYRLLDKSGCPVWVRDQTVFVYDKTGQPLFLQGIVFDITQSKALEETLRQSEQRHRELAQENAWLYNQSQQRLKEQAALVEAVKVISSTLDLSSVLNLIAQQMSQAVDATSAYICGYNSATLMAEVLAEYFSPYASAAEKVSDLGAVYYLPQEFPITFAFMQSDKLAQLLHADDPNLPEQDRNHLYHFGARSILITRLQISGELLGFAVLWESRHPREFTPGEVALTQAIAQQAAISIKNARLLEQARQNAETKAILLEEVNHRVKNNLSTIIGLLYAERRHHPGEESQATFQVIMQDLINRVQGLSTVHSLLSAAEWSPILLSELAQQVIASVLQSLPADKQVLVKVTPSPVRVTPQQANNLAMVINELTTNTVKYGVQMPATAQISIKINSEGEFIVFEFKNNGPDYPADVLNLQRYNVGIYLIQNIISKGLRGELTLSNEAGPITTIRFPASDE